MPSKSKKRAPPDSPSAFLHHLTEALKHIHDPRWLGEHSPLAAPYFLGERLRPAPTRWRNGARPCAPSCASPPIY